MPHSRSRSSPKKKGSKRKAVDSDVQANSTKKLRAGAEIPLQLQQPEFVDNILATRRSGHAGAGTGGRAVQLEKIGALLDASHMRTTQHKGTTSLDLNTPVNPLAPEQPRKGRGSHSKIPPPPLPYSPSETVDPPSSGKQGKKDKATKKGVAPASTSSCEVPNVRPSFSHCKPGSQFGFRQSLTSSGTDVHLQVNNTLVAATKKPSDPTAHPPPPIYPTPKAPTTSTSVMRQADTNFYKNLDPALRSTADVSLELRDTASESSDSETTDDGDERDDDDKDSSSGDDDDNGQDAHGDQEVGWGAAYGRHSAHPGFSKEAQPSQPLVTTALPTDFEFQHSCDEDDNAAMKSLVADVTSSTDDASTPVMSADVLHLHHKRNGRPCPPNPVILDLLHQAETKDLKLKPKVKSKSKASREGPKATQLGWYGPRWKSFLEYAKGECGVQHAIENPFPKFVDNLPGSVNEALMSLLVEWLEEGKQVEEGVWPDRKHDMAKLLYEDLSMWRSDLKKIITSIAPSLYDLIPPSDIPPQECSAWVKEAVTMLLEDSAFLCYGMDELGKTQNAAHPALHEAVIAFFYTGSYRVARRRPDIFQTQLPLECLALVCTVVNCVLDGLKRNGNSKSIPKFTSKEYGALYESMFKLLRQLMDDPYHGPKLVRQLRSWAEAGWQAARFFMKF
ncbi:uncharacterized protein F5891DRAFT_1196555 [Suillus fuscotomentosus]|uniref:DUF6532 domain-containing protein n=1 Tax=Suillus fuscotomentosus TaxID=1912939 RepID=A0AAD4HF93_9AGAM|nr:uncharacterized protein F5891DRAFT_1196555 [Suillus fuscotomentosus]KAG1893324.1 hypothetical protein F5891DRAFT_1196555 [Suillus fuscotomentosus]